MEVIHALRLLLKTYPAANQCDNPEYQTILAAIAELERVFSLETELGVIIRYIRKLPPHNSVAGVEDRIVGLTKLMSSQSRIWAEG